MKKCFKVLLISVVAICATELILRSIGFADPPIAVIDSEIEYYLKPNMVYSRFNNKIEINKYGMRSHDFSPEDKFDFEISIFGDSIVYGNHFLDQKYTIASRLRSHYIESANLDVRVSAIASSSWGPQNIEAYIKKFGIFPGNIAILVQSSHDRFDVIPCKLESIVPYRTQPSMTAITDALFAIVEKIKPILLNNKSVCEKLPPQERLSLTSKSLSNIIINLKDNYERVIFIFHPTAKEVIFHGSENQNSEIYYRQLARRLKIDYINATEYYLQVSEPTNMFEDDIHLSEYGTLQFEKMLLKQLELYY